MVRIAWEIEDDVRPAPNQVRNDVLRTTLTHSATRISIRVRYAELRRLGGGYTQYMQMVTNEGVRRNLDLAAHRDDWAGRTVIRRGRDGSPVRCALRQSIDYTHNVIAISFPRQCASSPDG